jgi:hypothetical protein
MIAAAILLAASAVPQSLLSAADAAGMAQTQCLFATFRAANQAHLSPAEFDSRLRSSCSAQSRELSRLSARIFSLRGDANPSAKAESLIEASYRSMVEEYRRFPEKEKLMRDFCESNPASCR